MASLTPGISVAVFTFWWICVLTEQDQQITVKTGDDVTLQCLDHRGGDIELLEWKRQDLAENILVCKHGKMCEDNQHPSFKNRVELRDPEMKDGNVSVILKNITINDTGTYECRVKNNTQALQLITNITLTVTDQQITVKTGDDVTLQCLGHRGGDIELLESKRQNQNVFVWKHEKISEDLQHPSFKNRVELRDPEMKDGDVSLILKNVTINDAGIYECYAGNNTTSSSKSITNIALTVTDQQITVKTGDDVTLQCLDHRGGDIELLEWKRQELTIFVWKHEKISEDLEDPSFKNRVELRDQEMKDGDVSVILKNVTINDNGTYECRVRNSNTQAPQLITNITLTVINSGGVAGYTKDGEDKDGGDIDRVKTVQPGEDVLLPCQGPRGADIVFVQWIRPELESEGSVFFFRDNRTHENYQHPSFHSRVELRDPQMKDGDVSVILKNINIKDTGTYECYVRIKGSRSELINSVYLKVKDLGGDKDGGDRVGLIFGLLAVIVLPVFLVAVGFTMYRKSKRLKMQIHQPPADEAAEPELQNMSNKPEEKLK